MSLCGYSGLVPEPLTKPDHLKPVEDDESPGVWIAKRKFAVAAGVLGVLSFFVVAVTQNELWATPDWRFSLPGFGLTAIASGLSLARREPKGYWIWPLGLALAAAAIVLGWFFMIAVVVAGAALLMLILHALL